MMNEWLNENKNYWFWATTVSGENPHDNENNIRSGILLLWEKFRYDFDALKSLR